MITKIKNIHKIITYDVDLKSVVSREVDSILIKDNKILSIYRKASDNLVLID